MASAMPEPGMYRLASGEVHVWCAGLDLPPETAARLHTTLSADERKRSARFRFQRDRRHFAAAHGVLRDLLGRYLETQAERISYVYNAFGKPELSHEFAGRFKFNLSHSASLALIAIAADSRVGVDLEHLRAQSDYAEITQQFFSATEIEQLSRLPQHLYAEAFLACWTRKEAYLKACGSGLATPLNSFSVPLASDPAPCPVDPDGAPNEKPWSFHTLRPAPGYIGALAIEESDWRLSQRQWNARQG